jgi:NAD(P)-dependent dehydrogenase (short-subunit alcohol dehydrogenase family)
MAEDAQASEPAAQEEDAMNDNPAFRVWLVTGASSGFGRAIAEALAQFGRIDVLVNNANRTQVGAAIEG